MTRSQKAELIDFLTSEFNSSNAVVACDYKGMAVKELEAFRNKARQDNIKVRIVKNKLASIALKSAGVEGLELKDTNLLVWGEQEVELAKSVHSFAKDNNKFIVKTGYFTGELYNDKQIEALSKMPSKEELIGQLLSVWTAPARNFVYVLSAPTKNFVTGLNNLKEKLERE